MPWPPRRLFGLEEVAEGSMCSSEVPFQTDESFAVTVAIAVLQDRARMRRAVAIMMIPSLSLTLLQLNYFTNYVVVVFGQSFESHETS